MLPDPIHPSIVHFPIVLTALLPLLVAGAFLLARKGTPIRTAWLGVTTAAALLAGSAWLAVETGEQQEERVENVVGDQPLGTHEERATLFLYLAAGTLAVTLAGLARGRAGQLGRAAATAAALVLLPAGYLVGHSGGELVYKYGAAQAYVSATTAQGDTGQTLEQGGSRAGDDDDR
jgi:uncharacterized membrane protein